MEDWNSLGRAAGFESEKAMWETLYVAEELSVSDIAERLGYGIATIVNRLNKHGIARRARGGPNHSHKVTRLLFRLDQRLIFHTPSSELARKLHMHENTVYKYKRSVQSVKRSVQ